LHDLVDEHNDLQE
jgi:hypothetical protein